MTFEANDREALVVDGVPLLGGPTPNLLIEPAQLGAFISTRRDAPAARFALRLGRPLGVRRFAVCYREEPFWMRPRAGSDIRAIPSDTQLAWLELDSGQIVLLVPLVLAPFRASLEGRGDELWAVVDSGDPYTRGSEALVLYAAVGEDPFELARQGAALVSARLGTGKLRREKPVPSFVDDFGWCTWDAFYQEVSHAKVREGLESFRAGGIEPRFMILDDGWQSVRETETGERRLVGWGAMEDKFPGGLRATVELAKRDYRVKTFLVWHAVHGYWGGIDGEALPGYGVDTALRWYSPEILRHTPTLGWDWWGACVGRPASDAIGRFYDEYHAHLVADGVDGVKVDNQSSIEGLSHGIGGRVTTMQKTAWALEQSVGEHFHGRLINCMSCSNDRLYQARASTLVRSSVDFWPNLPGSHGLHVYTNAMVGLWFGEFIHPDWDMFQSGHQAGAFHAAARAVSGAPVYVSDKPDGHDFGVLRGLVLSDGSVLRAQGIGLPTRDCLFTNPLEEAVLCKVFNTNQGSGVVGVFNARYRETDNRIEGSVSPADVEGLAGDEFAVYLGRAQKLVAPVAKYAAIPLGLDTLESEIATIVPIDRGIAPVGLADKLNAGGAVVSQSWQAGSYRVELRDGGRFVAYAEERPERVTVDGQDAEFFYQAGQLDVAIAKAGPCSVEIWPTAGA